MVVIPDDSVEGHRFMSLESAAEAQRILDRVARRLLIERPAPEPRASKRNRRRR